MGLLASEDDLLYNLCQHGAFYPSEEHPLIQDMVTHANKNSEQIKELVDGGPYGVLLILGPGPGNDLPLSYLVEKFDHTIMIDGFLDPMREWVEQNSHYKSKITLIQYDLSGGFYSFIADNKEIAINALSQDILLCEKSINCIPKHYKEFIFEHDYPLEFHSYKPNVIISSLVTSQISYLAEHNHCFLVNEAFNKIKERMKSDENDKINIRNSIFMTSHDENRRLHAITYYNALIESNAQKIYHSDTIRPGLLPEAIFDQFIINMDNKYRVACGGKNAWHYTPNLPVCYVSFTQKQRCHQCALYIDKIQRCSKCKKAKYCNRECQQKAWPKHKKECLY